MPDMNGNMLHMRPTLVFGLGGTGYDVVARAKGRFLESYSAEHLRAMRFIVLDTDPDHVPVRNSQGRLITLEPGEELIHIGGVPVEDIMTHMRSFREIAEEIPLQRLPRVTLIQGAKQVRALGRLAFFFHFSRIRDVIRNALRSILNIEHGAGEVNAINFLFISSACGGTGSSAIIDLAYLSRYLAQGMGVNVSKIFSIGLLVMPEAFPNVPEANRNLLRANASATLAELDHFTNYGDFDVTYPGNTRVQIQRPPFNLTYLVDAVNENHVTVKDLSQLAPILADAVFLQAGSYLGAQIGSAFDNMASSLGHDVNGYLRAYSMIGTATLRFNASRMQQACAYRLTDQVVRDVLLKEFGANGRGPGATSAVRRPDPVIQGEVEAYLSSAHLTPDLLQIRLKETTTREPMVIGLSTERYDTVPKEQMVKRVEVACETYAQEVIRDQYLEQIARNRQELQANSLNLLTETVYRLSDDLSLGLDAAYRFLNLLQDDLLPIRQYLQKEQAANRDQAARLRGELDQARTVMEESVGRFDLGGRRRQAARRAYTDRYRRYLTYVLEQGLTSQSLALLDAVEARRQQLLGAIANLRSILDKVAGDARRSLAALEKSWTPAHVTELGIDDMNSVVRFYDRYLNQSVRNEAQELLRRQELSGWLQQLQENPEDGRNLDQDIAAWLLDHAMKRYQRLVRDETVEARVKQRYQDAEAQRLRIHELITLGAPFSNYNLPAAGQGSDTLGQVLVVGVNNRDTSIYSGLSMKNATLVSTFDPHRISVLHTRHGLSVYALQQYDDYRKHFAEYQALIGATPIIGFKAVQREMIVRALFAQAEALGLIHEQGAAGYVAQLSPPRHLGDTLGTALQAVVKDLLLEAAITQWLQSWRQDHSYTEAIAALERYLSQPERSPRPLHLELQTAAEAELNRYRQLSYARAR